MHKLIVRSVGPEQFQVSSPGVLSNYNANVIAVAANTFIGCVSQKRFKEWTAGGADKAEVDINSITGEPIDTKMFKLFIQYCYTGSLNWREISDMGLLDMMAICHEYHFHHLAEVLVEGCSSRSYLTIWNVWYFYAAANLVS